MHAYQFCFDREEGHGVYCGDGMWAQMDLNPSMSSAEIETATRELFQYFPPAAEVVLNFPVWQNTPDARRMVLRIVHKFAEHCHVDASVYLPCATAEEMWALVHAMHSNVRTLEIACEEREWALVHAMHSNVRTLEIACEERVDGVGDLWAARPQLEKLTVVAATDGKFDGASCEFLRNAE